MIEIKGVDPRMIANNLIPFEPTHPGELIKSELECRGISQRKLAAQIGVSYTLLNEVLNEKRSVNTELALLLEAALGISAGLFVRMQASYNLQVAQKDKRLLSRLRNWDEITFTI